MYLFYEKERRYLLHFYSDGDFKCTIVNRKMTKMTMPDSQRYL